MAPAAVMNPALQLAIIIAAAAAGLAAAGAIAYLQQSWGGRMARLLKRMDRR